MDETWLTYRQAAHRVHRTIRTIRRWKKNGMPTILRHGIRYVEEETLLAWWRQRLSADPVHQARLRARRRSISLGEISGQKNETGKG